MANNDSTDSLSLWAEILRLDKELEESVKVVKHIVKIIDDRELSDDEKVKNIRVYIKSVDEKKNNADKDKVEKKETLRYVVSGGVLD